MSFEKIISEQWSTLKTLRGSKEADSASLYEQAEQKLFRVLNVPATRFNSKRLDEMLKTEQDAETFMQAADRFIPSMDMETEEKFKAYLQMYGRIRGAGEAKDVVAFFRGELTTKNLELADGWLKGSTKYAELQKKLPPPK